VIPLPVVVDDGVALGRKLNHMCLRRVCSIKMQIDSLSADPGPGPSFGGEHRPFEWGWRAVGLCSPCLRWWGRLCRRRCAAGGYARAVLVWGGVSRGYTIIIVEIEIDVLMGVIPLPVVVDDGVALGRKLDHVSLLRVCSIKMQIDR